MLRKDFFREIRKNAGRFISIFFIVLLGTAFYAGVRSANYDMKYTADSYFDDSRLMDIRVIGSLGLTDQDIRDMQEIPGVEKAVGGYTKEVLCDTGENELVLKMIAGTENINHVTLDEGRLPEKDDECLADTVLLTKMDFRIGDQITVASGTDEALEDSLNYKTYTIVGTGYLPYYMDLTRGVGSIGDGNIDAFLVVNPGAFNLDVYTEAYVQLKGAQGLQSYSDAYDSLTAAAVDELEAVGEKASERRYEEVRSDGEKELEDARRQVEDGEQELEDARQELEDGRQKLEEAEATLEEKEQELEDGRSELEQGEQELADARAQVEDGERQLQEAEDLLDQKEAELNAAREQYQTGLAQYQAGEAAYNQQKAEYDQGLAQYQVGEALYAEEYQKYQAGLEQFQSQGLEPQAVADQFDALDAAKSAKEAELEQAGQDPEQDPEYQMLKAQWEAMKPVADAAKELLAAPQKLQDARDTLDATKQRLDDAGPQLQSAREQLDATKGTLDNAARQISEGDGALTAGRQELEGKKPELAKARAQMEAGEAELADARRQVEDGEQQLKDGREELEEKRRELEDGEQEYQEAFEDAQPELADARQKIEDGQAELDDLEVPKWYVLDRDKISSCVGFGQDAERMKNLGEVFPVIFFLVAALVSLTAMTRMVEEQRLQIGTLKALGYSDGTIAVKYFSYAMLATVSGSICGILIGEKVLPYVIMDAYGMLYTGLPEYLTPINWDQAFLALAAAAASTGIATLVACFRELKAKPADLMRPEAPKSGRRVFLERVTILWKRLSFTQKSTLRNLIRYKKRFFMTIIGIGGCMALMLVGFGLEDSITEIAKRQYVDIFTYDASATLNTKASDAQREEFMKTVSEREGVTGTIEVCEVNVDLENGRKTRSANLYVPSDVQGISDFLTLRDRKSQEVYEYPREGVALSEKTAKMLNVSVGGTIQIKKGDESDPVPVKVTRIVENYIQHYAFLSPDTYEQLFGEAPEYDYFYLNYEDHSAGAEQALGQELMHWDACSGVSFVTDLEEQINDMLKSLNIVIYVLIFSAGLLAFVVLYNLNSINITERQRELATLKVLGFYDKEVAMYVYRENILLTVIGILVGAFMGAVLHQFTILTVEVDLMMFGRIISPGSFFLSGIITVLFSVLVNFFMFYRLRKIDMIESLKSVE